MKNDRTGSRISGTEGAGLHQHRSRQASRYGSFYAEAYLDHLARGESTGRQEFNVGFRAAVVQLPRMRIDRIWRERGRSVSSPLPRGRPQRIVRVHSSRLTSLRSCWRIVNGRQATRATLSRRRFPITLAPGVGPSPARGEGRACRLFATTVSAADRTGNSRVPVNQRSREFEDRNSLTSPDLAGFGTVTEISISKKRSRTEPVCLTQILADTGENAKRREVAPSGVYW